MAAFRIVPMVRTWISASAFRTLSAKSAYRGDPGRSGSLPSPRAIHSQKVPGGMPTAWAATSRGAPDRTAVTICSATFGVSRVDLPRFDPSRAMRHSPGPSARTRPA